MNITIHERVEDLPAPAPDGAYVVIDVLRFSTTVAVLVSRDVAAIHPFADPEAARSFAAETDAVLVGERNGEKLDGFDHSNSPTELMGADVAGETVAITTTNGTRALSRVPGGAFIGGTVNAGSVAEAVPSDQPVHLLCAGTEGRVSADDVAGADLIAAHLRGEVDDVLREEVRERVRESWYADRLRSLDCARDVGMALTLDRYAVAPVHHDGVIR